MSSESVYCIARQRSISFSSDDKASPASRPILCNTELTHLCCCCDLMPFATLIRLVDVYRHYRARCLICRPRGNRRSSSVDAYQLALSNARCSMVTVWSLALLVGTHMQPESLPDGARIEGWLGGLKPDRHCHSTNSSHCQGCLEMRRDSVVVVKTWVSRPLW